MHSQVLVTVMQPQLLQQRLVDDGGDVVPWTVASGRVPGRFALNVPGGVLPLNHTSRRNSGSHEQGIFVHVFLPLDGGLETLDGVSTSDLEQGSDNRSFVPGRDHWRGAWDHTT